MSSHKTREGPAGTDSFQGIPEILPHGPGVDLRIHLQPASAVLGRSLLPPLRDEFDTYPLARWRRDTLDCLKEDKILDYPHMHSGRLYNAERLADFLEQARFEEFDQEACLGRILAVEMALRSVGASF